MLGIGGTPFSLFSYSSTLQRLCFTKSIPFSIFFRNRSGFFSLRRKKYRILKILPQRWPFSQDRTSRSLSTVVRKQYGRLSLSGSVHKLSSINFCTKDSVVVIITTCEKIRNLFNPVEKLYVNLDCIQPFRPPVENLCGKTCGECGKVVVFNSYSGVFNRSYPCG